MKTEKKQHADANATTQDAPSTSRAIVSRPVQLPVTKVDDSAFAVAWAPTQHSVAHVYTPARVTPAAPTPQNNDRGSVSEPVN